MRSLLPLPQSPGRLPASRAEALALLETLLGGKYHSPLLCSPDARKLTLTGDRSSSAPVTRTCRLLFPALLQAIPPPPCLPGGPDGVVPLYHPPEETPGRRPISGCRAGLGGMRPRQEAWGEGTAAAACGGLPGTLASLTSDLALQVSISV